MFFIAIPVHKFEESAGVEKSIEKKKKWVLTKKCETLSAPYIKYVLVALNNLSVPEYHIVPSEYLSRTLYEDHKNWLATPGIKVQTHKDNAIRNFSDEDNKFLNCWELLDES